MILFLNIYSITKKVFAAFCPSEMSKTVALYCCTFFLSFLISKPKKMGARPSDRASDSRLRGWGVETPLALICVLEQDVLTPGSTY